MDDEWIYEKHFDLMSTEPSYWHSKSIHLREAAQAVAKEELFDAGATYRMLMGMSLEVLFKAFYVAELKANKAIASLSFNHNLNELSKHSGLEFSERERSIMEGLTEYVLWQGKYPTPKDKKRSPGPNTLKEQWTRIKDAPPSSPKLFDDSVVSLAKYAEDDFSFARLLRLWKKAHQHFIGLHI